MKMSEQKIEIKNNPDFFEFKNNCLQGYKVYVPPEAMGLSRRKLQSLKRIAVMQRYYQCNPVRFIQDFFSIQLLDAQAWIVTQSFITSNVLLLCCRGFGKSTLIDLIVMTKGMLFNNYWTWLCAGSAPQAQGTFLTLEKLANDNIDTMVGSTGRVFKNELVIKQANNDGFTHGSGSFSYKLYNGSQTGTVAASVNLQRGKRGNVVFDESAFLDEELLTTYASFAIVNRSFKSGRDANGNPLDINRIRAIPEEIENQKFYISSASSTDTEYYRIYRDFSKRMLMGDKNYFVASIDCNIAFEPTIHGKLVKPLLSRETVESALRTAPDKARRQYLNTFTTDAGANAIIKRSAIMRNEETRVPLLNNDTGDKKFILGWDPATRNDNSIVQVFEIYEDKLPNGEKDIKARFVNCINLIDMKKKKKSPMQIPDQVKAVRKMILDYNGGADGYRNILGIYCDAGAAGNAAAISSLLLQDFTTPDGITHPGLIDTKYSSDYVSRFPNAIRNIIHFEEPTGMKSIMYEEMILMINQNKISFTANYDNKDYLTVFDIDQKKMSKLKQQLTKKYEKKGYSGDQLSQAVQSELESSDLVKTKTIKLTTEEKVALIQMDATKDEIVSMVRKPRSSGKDSFELTPEKVHRMHDDRSFAACLCSHGLSVLRHKELMNRKPEINNDELINMLTIRRGKYNGKKI